MRPAVGASYFVPRTSYSVLCTLCLALLPLLVAAPPAAGPQVNSCTNGSFEELSPGGFPADWSPVGSKVEVSSDAHSGKRSLRLVRMAGTKEPETGLNRGYRQGDGKQGRMLDRLKGGMDFWYKAVSASPGTKLQVYVIPMSDEAREDTSSARARFTVPEGEVGDGQWRRARFKYDFTANPKVKWVHFAARIEGTAGEMLVDDVSYVEKVGPVLRFGKPRLEEDLKAPGERGTLVVSVENVGDEPAKGVRARIALAAGLATQAAEVAIGDLAPDGDRQARWTIDGARNAATKLDLEAVSGDLRATAIFPIAPKLVLRSFGPVSPVVIAGGKVVLECVVANEGNAFMPTARAEFLLLDSGSNKSPPFPPWATKSSAAERIPPGRSVTLSAEFPADEPRRKFVASVRIYADNALLKPEGPESRPEAGPGRGRVPGECFVPPNVPIPAPSGKLHAATGDEHAILENEHVRLVFRRYCGELFDRDILGSPGELSVRTTVGWRTVAWARLLQSCVVNHAGFDPNRTSDPYCRVTAHMGPPARLVFDIRRRRDAFVQGGTMTMAFSLASGERTIAARYEFTPEKAYGLSELDGPMLYVLDRDEAVFPGLEWLVGDERSSDTLDIAEGHEHQVRYVVHPNMVTIPAVGIHGRSGTVGLLWDVHQKWDGARDRPSVVFASPDRFGAQRSHLMGLLLPSVPEFVEPNERQATKPYRLEPGKPLVLECRIYADSEAKDALSAIDEWIKWKGLPKPSPLPHGSYEREIEFSAQAYLKSLWVPDKQEWWTTKGGGILSQTGRPRDFLHDLLMGEALSQDAQVRQACRARTDEVLKLIGGEGRLGLVQFHGRADLQMANPMAAANLLATRDERGAWPFDADQKHTTGPFVGMDYHELGPDNAVEVGTCARNAYEVLRYARVAGDWDAYRAMRPTLELMETFRVPRAAQVWEVPVHTPDLLAAADAVDAYMEAYRYSGDERWLRDAVAWARRGLPFVYLWNDPEKPFLVGGSIPVFGATWYRGSWFGRPVQWNGLRYADAVLKLAEHDNTHDWRRIAELLIHSAIQQQDREGENVALWPDNISAIDSQKCPWVFSPRMIVSSVSKLIGRDEEPATAIVGEGEKRLHVSTAGRISGAAWDGRTLSFGVNYPAGQQGIVLVSNVAHPDAVLIDGKPAGARDAIEIGAEPGWRYDVVNAFLAIRIAKDGQSTVRIDGAAFRRVERIPALATAIDFKLDDSMEGWQPAHDVADLKADGKSLVGRITGGDPYIIRPLLRVRGDDCPVLRLRMKVTAGRGGQLFWTTERSPAFGEDKTLRFELSADGQWHEYRLEPGQHPQWAGQTITAIRLDPGGGAGSAEFAVDYVRGE